MLDEVLYFLALFIPIVIVLTNLFLSSIDMFFSKSNIKYMKIHINPKINSNFDIQNAKITSAYNILEELSNLINKIYPKCNFTISIKLVIKSNREDPSDSDVTTLASYPNQIRDHKFIYKIKYNTEFSAITLNRNDYFFVSELAEYKEANQYVSESSNSNLEYNTSIVFPIQYIEKNIQNIVGFLCIASHQKLTNVKKNRQMVALIKSYASLIYQYLNEHGLIDQTISIKM